MACRGSDISAASWAMGQMPGGDRVFQAEAPKGTVPTYPLLYGGNRITTTSG